MAQGIRARLMRRGPRRFLLVLISVGAATVAVELMARRFLSVSDALFVSDPVVGISHVPNGSGRWKSPGEFDTVVSFNSQGFRDAERAFAKPAGTQRIVVLGDSMTEALQVEAPATFVSVLEKELQAADRRVEALNLGISSIGTAQQYLVLEHYGFRYAPDVVLLVMFTGNDFRNNSQVLERDSALSYPVVDAEGHLQRSADGSPQFTGPAPQSRVRAFLRAHFALYRILRESIAGQRWRQLVRKNPETSEAELVRQYGLYRREWSAEWKAAVTTTFEVLDALNERARRRQARLVVAVIPAAWELSEQWRRSAGLVGDAWDVERPERLLLQFLGQNGILGIPLGEKLREALTAGTDVFFKSDGHLTPVGHRIVGEELARKLLAARIMTPALAAAAP